MFHAEPSHISAVGRICRGCVITHHSFGYVFGSLGSYVVQVKVGVGRQRILHAGLFTRHIDELLAVGRPCKRLNASKGFHRRLIRFISHDIHDIRHFLSVKIGKKRMRYLSHPLVPMLVHEVINNTTGGFGQVRIYIFGRTGIFYV